MTKIKKVNYYKLKIFNNKIEKTIKTNVEKGEYDGDDRSEEDWSRG